MEEITHHCDSCMKDTPQVDIGFIPQVVLEGDQSPDDVNYDGQWVKCSLCKECGSAVVHSISSDQVYEAQDTVINEMFDIGVITEEEKESILNPDE